MAVIRKEFLVRDQGTTFNAAPVPFGIFEWPNTTAGMIFVVVQAIRSDGAYKSWTVDAAIKKIGGVLAILSAVVSAPFGSAADLAALSTVGIAPFSDATFFGVNCTGQAAQTIEWLVDIDGPAMSPV